MSKRIIAIALLALLLVTAVGCTPKQSEKSDKLSVVTTIYPQYDFVRAICKEKAEYTMLLSPGSEAHGFEASLSDVSKIKNSELFVCVGGESEDWVLDLFSSEQLDTMLLRLIDLVVPLPEETVEGMEHEDHEDGEDHDHEDGEDHDHEVEFDEHVWTSPKRCIPIAEAIRDAVMELDPDNADYYKTNADELISQLRRIDEELVQLIATAHRSTILCSERFPFRYLCYDYGLSYYASFAGCSSNTEPALSTIAFLIERVKTEKLPVVFYTEFSKQTVADTICEATGAKKLQLHSCHNVSLEDFNAGITYIDLMEANLITLREALN